MEKICAFVDAQGYFLRNKFFPREVAFINESISHCQEFNPDIQWFTLTEKEAKTIRHMRTNIHGLSLNAFKNKRDIIPISDDYIPFLKKWYSILATNERSYFAVKNKVLFAELKNAQIPVIDLDDPEINMPSVNHIEKLYDSNWLCAYHCRFLDNKSKYRCALRKCYNVWKFLINKPENEEIVNKEEPHVIKNEME
jgi:hypothetical protein